MATSQRAAPEAKGAANPTIDDVRGFWDANPLWSGEGCAEPGTRAYFDEHRAVVHRDCFAGAVDEHIFPDIDKNARVLDLGCGIGFWLVEFWQRGFRNLHGADLSPNSLELARKRCGVYGVQAELSVRNAEATGFDDASFDHVNCQGVVHHTPSPPAALREIHRIIRPGGTASISVYYKNTIIRNWRSFRAASKLVSALGGGLKGRGRERIFAGSDVDDIVRTYDGAENPIGIAYDREAFKRLIGPGFRIDSIYFHFFPARAAPVAMPRALHRILDRKLPFMIYCNVTKL